MNQPSVTLGLLKNKNFSMSQITYFPQTLKHYAQIKRVAIVVKQSTLTGCS